GGPPPRTPLQPNGPRPTANYPPPPVPPRAPASAPGQPLTEIGAKALEASKLDSAKLRSTVQRSRSKLGGPPPGAAVIGRAEDSDVVISDVLASRHHAYLIPNPAGGMEIHDAQSINGTFVNGTRILSAPLTAGDVVTIGNVDLVFNGQILLRRAEADARTGGL